MSCFLSLTHPLKKPLRINLKGIFVNEESGSIKGHSRCHSSVKRRLLKKEEILKVWYTIQIMIHARSVVWLADAAVMLIMVAIDENKHLIINVEQPPDGGVAVPWISVISWRPFFIYYIMLTTWSHFYFDLWNILLQNVLHVHPRIDVPCVNIYWGFLLCIMYI